MKAKYISPKMIVTSIQTQNLVALSVMNEEADFSEEVLAPEEKLNGIW